MVAADENVERCGSEPFACIAFLYFCSPCLLPDYDEIPDTIEPAVILTIGYPESPDLFEQTSKKRKTLEEIIKEETF